MKENSNDLWQHSKGFGLKGIKYFSVTLLLFLPINILAFISAIFYFKNENLIKYMLSISSIILVGIGFVAIACYFTYQYLLKDAYQLIYKQSTSFLQNMCMLTTEKICDAFIDEHDITSKKIAKVVDIGEIISSSYSTHMPLYIQKGLQFLIRRIPFAELTVDLASVAQQKSKQEASALLYQRVDEYIEKTVFSKNSMRWKLWLFSINCFFMVGLIIFINKLIL